jgi:hypothetical protein
MAGFIGQRTQMHAGKGQRGDGERQAARQPNREESRQRGADQPGADHYETHRVVVDGRADQREYRCMEEIVEGTVLRVDLVIDRAAGDEMAQRDIEISLVVIEREGAERRVVRVQAGQHEGCTQRARPRDALADAEDVGKRSAAVVVVR